MTEFLRLSLLGTPQILLGDRLMTGTAAYKKTEALLFYLAVTGHTGTAQSAQHSRDALATLLWGEQSDAQAKQNLRTVLSDLRRLVGDHVQIERQSVAFDHTSPHWLDVAVIRRTLEPSQSAVDLAARQAAVDLYQGEFLHGFYIRDAPAFESWVVEQREQLHTLMVNALTALVDEYALNGNAAVALAANRRLLVLEPWSEPTHRQQMVLLAQTGDRAAALAQYETCRRVLAAEFGIEPLPETTALYEQIRTTGSWSLVIGHSSVGAASEQQGEASHSPDGNRPMTNDKGPMTNDPPPLTVTGHNLPLRTKLFGRQAELATLHKWILEDGCRLVGIFGIGGQGKTTLAATLVRKLEETSRPPADALFRHIIWHSLQNAPPLAEVLQAWVYLLSDQTVTTLPASPDQQLSQLLDYLQHHRSLLILDNLESILQSDEQSDGYRPGYEAYAQLMRRLAEGEHRSCLLLTSRERPPALAQLEEETPAVRSLTLSGLPAEAGRQMLQGRGLSANLAGLGALVEHYSGNPLALKLAAETVQEIFDGNIAAFLQTESLVFDDIRHVLDQQFARLTPLESELIHWLAIVREPVPFTALRTLLAQPPASRLVLEAVRSLQRRSLLEKFEEGFGLQNVILEYSTDRLVEEISRELLDDRMTGWQDDRMTGWQDDKMTTAPENAIILSSYLPATWSHFNRYALILAQAKEYVRTSQTRLLLQPIAERLVTQLGKKGAAQQLQRQLTRLRTARLAPGYAAANLLHLLLHCGVELSGYDFSQLYFRQLHLRGVSLAQTNFAGTEIIESVFTEPFGMVYTTVFSRDGQYLAAGTSEGAIYLWRTADQQLAQVLQVRGQAINELIFARRLTADGETQLMLASASNDTSIDVWLLAERPQERWHTSLSHPQAKKMISVGFHPNGRRVTGVDGDGQLFVWDVNSPEDSQLVQHYATMPTYRELVAYSGDGRTVAVGHREGTVQVRQVATGQVEMELTVTTGFITALALRGDGRLLVTGGKEGQLCFWAVPAGQLQQVIETKRVTVDALAFSADGKLLATAHGVSDYAIRLWVIDAESCWRLRYTLLGYTHATRSIAFGPHPAANGAGAQAALQELLVTGSSDQTLRVWDVTTGHSLYTLRGHPRALSAIAVHARATTQSTSTPAAPQAQEWLLAVVGYDQLVHLWVGRGPQPVGPSRTFRGPSKALYAVEISPDGRTLAAAGQDAIVYLWDIASGQLLQSLPGHTTSIFCVAFHPDGALLASGSTDGTVRLWGLTDLRPGRVDDALPDQPVVVLRANPRFVYDVAFSPDGRSVAAVGADLSVRLWDMTQSHRPELVEARKTVLETGEHDIYSVAFSPDGLKMACGGNYLIHLWDLGSDQPPQRLQQHTSWIFSVVFSPDGATLASSSPDRTVCLWDVASSALRATLRGHTETVYKVVFSPDGAFVVSCSFDGSIKFWDAQSGECVNTFAVEGPYAGMNITGVTGITAAQKAALKALGAVESATGIDPQVVQPLLV
jgi:WD40 repeat protein/DNA-binding SARP family transcriptional activator